MKSFSIKSRILTCLIATLLLTACGMPQLEKLTVEDMTYTLYGNGRTERIEVERDGRRIGSYAAKGMTEELLTKLGDRDHGFLLSDLNFDGKTDMLLKTANTKSGLRYAAFLWDDAKGEYVSAASLSALTDIGMIASLQVITAREYEYTVDPAVGDMPEFYTERHSIVLYRWISGKLTEVHRKDRIYYEENDIYCYAVYDFTDEGELELSRESWVDPEKMNDEKYPLDATGFEGYAVQD